jgi:hypothetical protein
MAQFDGASAPCVQSDATGRIIDFVTALRTGHTFVWLSANRQIGFHLSAGIGILIALWFCCRLSEISP